MIPAEFMLSDDRVCGLEGAIRKTDAIGSAATKFVTNDYQIGIEKYFKHIVVKPVLVLEL